MKDIKNKILMQIVMLLSTVFILSCGKEGMPVPPENVRNFEWKTTSARKQGDCIIFSGTFEGSHQNLKQIRLELAPVDEENCPTCPFLPKETVFFSTKEAGYEENIGQVSFAFCPQKASAYRWRLIGLSVYSRSPNTVSPINIIHMEEEEKLFD